MFFLIQDNFLRICIDTSCPLKTFLLSLSRKSISILKQFLNSRDFIRFKTHQRLVSSLIFLYFYNGCLVSLNISSKLPGPPTSPADKPNRSGFFLCSRRKYTFLRPKPLCILDSFTPCFPSTF